MQQKINTLRDRGDQNLRNNEFIKILNIKISRILEFIFVIVYFLNSAKYTCVTSSPTGNNFFLSTLLLFQQDSLQIPLSLDLRRMT